MNQAFQENVKVPLGQHLMEWAVYYKNQSKIPKGLQQFINQYPDIPRQKIIIYTPGASQLRFYKQNKFAREVIFPNIDATLEYSELREAISSLFS